MNHKFYDFTIIVYMFFFFLIFNILCNVFIKINTYIDDSQLISFNFLSEIINLIKL